MHTQQIVAKFIYSFIDGEGGGGLLMLLIACAPFSSSWNPTDYSKETDFRLS